MEQKDDWCISEREPMTNKENLEIIKTAIECNDKIELFSENGDLLEISDLWATPYGIALEFKTV